MYGHENITDPACVKSKTGYIITVHDCPILLQSKLHREPVLLTIEVKVMALT